MAFEEARPVPEDGRPVVVHETAASEEARPVLEDGRPTVDRTTVLVGQGPLDDDRTTLENDRSGRLFGGGTLPAVC